MKVACVATQNKTEVCVVVIKAELTLIIFINAADVKKMGRAGHLLIRRLVV